jgi:SWI/SNF-related matrix-associated actin-dependent regulator 1 of chromatin subfamily A
MLSMRYGKFSVMASNQVLTLPYAYQIKSVRQAHLWKGRALLALDMGLGKSFVALLYALRHPKLRPIVVVCPAGVKWVWEREAKTHAGMFVEVLEGMKPPSHGIPPLHSIVVVNYDILGPWLKHLKALRPKLVILDECHMLLSRTSKRTKLCRKLCKGVSSVLALSGTPEVIRPVELFPVLNILRSDLFPNFHDFGHRFCGPKLNQFGQWEFRGSSNIEELNKLLKHVMVRYRKQDVLTQLPPKQRIVVPLEIVNKNKYAEATNNFSLWLKRYKPGKAHKATKAKALMMGGYCKRLAAQLKLKQVFDWIDNFLADSASKLILFAIHRDIVKQLHERYAKISVVIDGSVVKDKRRIAIESFNHDRKIRLLIGNIKAAGVGWSATNCSDVAFVEYEWAPGIHTQAEDRVHGLKRGVKGVRATAWYLVARDTIEEKLVKLLQERQRVINRTLDGDRDGDDLSIFDILTKELLKADLSRAVRNQ